MSDTEAEVKRGRPRPQEVIDRDEAVFKAVPATKEGATSEQITESTGLDKNLVYLSVFRLRRDGRIERATDENGAGGRTRRWVRVKA